MLPPFNVVEDREEEANPAAIGIEQEQVGEISGWHRRKVWAAVEAKGGKIRLL